MIKTATGIQYLFIYFQSSEELVVSLILHNKSGEYTISTNYESKKWNVITK